MTRLYIPILLVMVFACSALPDESSSTESPTIVSDQLSHPNVRCFRQDAEGRMWIGTERGLNRFNGYDFHQYFYGSDSTSLPDNRIYDICLDRENRIWVGTEDGVALYTDRDRFVRIPIVSDEKSVHQVLCDRRGRVILNMQEDLCVYDSLSCCFVSAVMGFDRFFNYHSRCYFDAEGLLWVVSPREIRCFDTDGFVNVDNFPTTHFVTESVLLSDGQIWMYGQKRMSVFDTRTMRFRKMPETVTAGFPRREVQMMAEADSVTVLFRTSDGLFYLYDRGKDVLRTATADQLGLPPGFETSTFYRNPAGDLWFGSDDRGFHYVPFPVEALRSGRASRHVLDNKSVVSMSRDQGGNLWMYTLHDGLFRYDSTSGELSSVSISWWQEDRTDFLQTNLPLVQVTSAGEVWLSFPNQQQLLRGRYRDGRILLEDSFQAFYPRVSLEDSEGNVWFGTRNEYLALMVPGGKELKWVQVFPYQTTFINCLLQLGDELLVGAYNEPLTLLDIHTFQPRPLDIASRDAVPEFFYPTAFHQDRKGRIWIGTRFNGILRYDISRKNLVSVSGPRVGDISSIEEDNFGRIWVSTLGGIFWYDPEKDRFYDYLPLQGSAGHFFYERSSALLPDGLLAFGGAQGLALVSPSESPVEEIAPLLFEDLKIHNGWVSPGSGIIDRSLSKRPSVVLRHYDNSFSISFAAPDYRNLRQVRYYHKLEGFDQDWVETGSSREAYYANVPAGRYTFRVRHYLLSDEGLFGESSLSVRIRPSPWLSPWAISFYAVLTFLLAAFLWRTRRRIEREQAATREAEREKEHERKVNRMNMTFFSNVSMSSGLLSP